MSDSQSTTMRIVTVGSSRWAVARADPGWIWRYFTLLLLEILIAVFVTVIGLTDWLPRGLQSSYFLLAPAFALLGVYLGMSPGYLFARCAVRAIEQFDPAVEAWCLSALPLNVDTIRKLAQHQTPRASLVRSALVAFGSDSMSIWVKDGLSVAEAMTVPRSSVSFVRVVQNGTRPVLDLGSPSKERSQMVLVATKGEFSWSVGNLTKGAQYVESWARDIAHPPSTSTSSSAPNA